MFWCNGDVGTLPLGLDAQVVTHLAEGDLHLPALDEPADDPHSRRPWEAHAQLGGKLVRVEEKGAAHVVE